MDKWVSIVFTVSYCIAFADAQAPTPVPTFQYCPTDATYSYYIAQGKNMCYSFWYCTVRRSQAYTCPATGWCTAKNPHLMSITLPVEVTMLTDLIQTKEATSPGCIYVGATFVGGAWTWSDGQPFNAFSASVWAPGEPDMTGSRKCGAWCYNSTNAAMYSVDCTTFEAGYGVCDALAILPSTTTVATTTITTVTTTATTTTTVTTTATTTTTVTTTTTTTTTTTVTTTTTTTTTTTVTTTTTTTTTVTTTTTTTTTVTTTTTTTTTVTTTTTTTTTTTVTTTTTTTTTTTVTTTTTTTVTTTIKITTTTPKPYTKCCPNAGLLSAWSAWSGCTHTCGGCGTQTAGRNCYSTDSGCSPGCTGTVSQNQYCNKLPCVYPNTTCCASFTTQIVNNKHICVPSTTG